ncbi:hypothetical protein [Paenibacillus sp. GCM10028914]|uniref:hypothetical protein n=1 Tax=Paenibacillus sp. GCM10028914 TaxID=3273416 RepID=UPI0036D24B91
MEAQKKPGSAPKGTSWAFNGTEGQEQEQVQGTSAKARTRAAHFLSLCGRCVNRLRSLLKSENLE